jgi:hypothetical protein
MFSFINGLNTKFTGGEFMISKGKMIFVLTGTTESLELNYYLLDDDDFYKQEIYEYDFIDGKDFLESVRSGNFINYDGSISEIIVDGYVTNLGLCEEGLSSGEFLITGDILEEICNKNKVIVNWANK